MAITHAQIARVGDSVSWTWFGHAATGVVTGRSADGRMLTIRTSRGDLLHTRRNRVTVTNS